MVSKKIGTGVRSLSKLSLSSFVSGIRKYFFPWLIAAVILAALLYAVSFSVCVFRGDISTSVNFSFDGIEAGLDPAGNKFDVNSIKSDKIVEDSMKELGINNESVENVQRAISIDGVVPDDVIDRITSYKVSFGEGSEIITSKDVKDTTYYPTKYNISIDCGKVDISHSKCAELLNKMTEKYKTTFFETYGYNKSLESAVLAVEYSEYDYIDAVNVFESSLTSLKNYIDELAKKDDSRFRSQKTGYTFADLSKAIDTIQSEDLDWISSNITVNNVSKDKEILIANYQFKIDALNRSKKIAEEKLKSINETLEVYQKDSVLIVGGNEMGDTQINQSSGTYDKLLQQGISAQTEASSCQQKIDLYKKRISSLKSSTSKSGYAEMADEDLKNISDKISNLITIVNDTATDYYETELFTNSYSVLFPAKYSLTTTFKSALNNSKTIIVPLELILLAIYIFAAAIYVFIPDSFKEKLAGIRAAKSKNSGKTAKKKRKARR